MPREVQTAGAPRRRTASRGAPAATAAAWTASYLLPAVASASSTLVGGPHGSDGGVVFVNNPFAGEEKVGVLWMLINFGVLLLVLNKLLFIPLKRKTAAKHEAIKAQLDKATAAYAEADALVSEYRGRMERLDAEIEELRAGALRRAEADREAILAAAEAEAQRIKDAASAAAEREAVGRRKALENEILDRALERAEVAIRASLTSADHRRMVDDYVQDLGAIHLPHRGSPPAQPSAQPKVPS